MSDRPASDKIAPSPPQRPAPDYLVIGQVVKAHGLYGEVSVKILTDFPERFDAMETVFVGDDEGLDEYGVKSARWHKQNVLLTLEGVTTRTQAEALRGRYLKIPATEAMPLEPDTFFHHQLLGLAVETEDGRFLGRVAEIIETGANDVCVVRDAAQEILLPATTEVMPRIDIEAGRITVHVLDGLLD